MASKAIISKTMSVPATVYSYHLSQSKITSLNYRVMTKISVRRRYLTNKKPPLSFSMVCDNTIYNSTIYHIPFI